MLRCFYVAIVLLALLSAATALHAQSGCADSPEAPTVVLLLLGLAGIFYGSSLLSRRHRLKALRRGGS